MTLLEMEGWGWDTWPLDCQHLHFPVNTFMEMVFVHWNNKNQGSEKNDQNLKILVLGREPSKMELVFVCVDVALWTVFRYCQSLIHLSLQSFSSVKGTKSWGMDTIQALCKWGVYRNKYSTEYVIPLCIKHYCVMSQRVEYFLDTIFYLWKWQTNNVRFVITGW